ncbi:uncharacterized protein GIQ15_01928 [Arthroderma uncinatum]|uniref:uncharacterized protein n=1 Tax=Arthroderma uncinatum TaxID=74035 RepID=UPI00144A92D4|nr:uncharacterized protein GIQ15_01928 [Arthroderma uncinatum]KAF3492411.1 hypothetical protein GIQ15_01928 [Arthroderma uncinatum]
MEAQSNNWLRQPKLIARPEAWTNHTQPQNFQLLTANNEISKTPEQASKGIDSSANDGSSVYTMLKSTYTPANALPPGWTEHKAPSGHRYYYNAETKQSTYRRPVEEVPVQNIAPQAAFPSYPSPFQNTIHQAAPFHAARGFDPNFQGHPRSGKPYRERRQPEDRPKSKHAIPGCEPWVLVKTKLGRRFVHNTETNESFWKYPADVIKGVVEYDRIEREAREKRERGEMEEEEKEDTSLVGGEVGPSKESQSAPPETDKPERRDSDSEYEEVEVTDDEDAAAPKRLKGDEEVNQQVEFNEDDIEYQLAAMGGDYAADTGEYDEADEGGWEEDAEEAPLSEEDTVALFRDLLDDFHISPYTPWDTIIEEGKIIFDPRYTILPNMKSRREVWSNWSRDRIHEHQERKKKEEQADPRIGYFALLHERATPKLYWPEFRRKYRKEPEMKDGRMPEKDKEKHYREHIARLKLPESSQKSDLSMLLKSIPLSLLHRSTPMDALPPKILSDIRYISLPTKTRDELIESYIQTLPPAPEQPDVQDEEKEERLKKEQERRKREKALHDREMRVQEDKRKQQRAVLQGKDILRQEDAELQRAMKVGREGLKSYMEQADEASLEK